MAARLPIIANPSKDGDAKPGSTVTYGVIKIDRPTEKQNYGNVVTQSHGSTVTFTCNQIARPPKSK